MPRTRKPDLGSLAPYLFNTTEREIAAQAMQAELQRQQKTGRCFIRGHVFTAELLAAAFEAIAEHQVQTKYPGKADDPAPFT